MTPEEFIFEYLEADQDTGAGSFERMVEAIDTIDGGWNKVKPHILKLKYFYFLKTSYWMIISAEVKRRNRWRCSCGGRIGLQVHHESEGNASHGEEHVLLLGGLIRGLRCLCEKCHEKEHGTAKIKDAEKKRKQSLRKESILSQLPYYPGRVPEQNISGSSFGLTRRLLEELEHDRKVMIERRLYDGWQVHRI